MLLALIDGDGNIFQKELLKLGLHGGRQAAQLLTESITAYVRERDESGARAQLWVYLFFNMKGLLQTLVAHNICTADEFEAFITGFNQSNPRFIINDVHSGKEAANVKIKGDIQPKKTVAVSCMHSRIPFVLCSLPTHVPNFFRRYRPAAKVCLLCYNRRLFHTGGHDNGYLPTLTELQNEGLLDKVILLQGYMDVATELQSLSLPALRIDSLFIAEKISVKTLARYTLDDLW